MDSVEALGAWIVRTLDAAEVARVILVGHSMGSPAVLAAAAALPDRVERLALLGPAAPMAVSDALLEAARDDVESAYAMINAWSHSAAKQIDGNTVPGLWLMGSALRLMQRAGAGVLLRDLVACRDYTAGLDAAQAIGCPTLAILGAKDVMAPLKSAQPLLRALKDARTVTLPDTGHALMSEQPDAVLDSLRTFLAAG